MAIQRLASVVLDLATEFRYDIWNIGYIYRTLGRVDDLLAIPKQLTWFPAQRPYRYLADPFVVERGDGYIVFAEEYDYFRKGPKGIICRVAIKQPSQVQVIIREKHHLSYPCPFFRNGTTYLLPESCDSTKTGIYALDESLETATGYDFLLDGVHAVDPTLHAYRGRYYIFCQVRQRQQEYLHCYYAETPFGPWVSHPQNPLKTGKRGSRPGGKLFECRGEWFRPAQNCEKTYGGSLLIYKVKKLTPDVFEEEEILEIFPDRTGPYPHGLHHIHVEKDIIVMDAKKRHIHILWPLKKLLRSPSVS
uniref:Glucosamine inositolphosphorylceramide transferase 1 N-terminal domain-containing protein n=1 Tax=Candidatus Kentrum sp. FW TaxID=2126338 RepID=A0A450TDA5_9GAMM|nr:MAG: hypothetical protein BECKFW1821A_GA0114235_109413 [Candidatus Kentron sp. FW]VFJ64888.1 MAG: hypothetical protein BECKFW1821B_GA0114236_109811 [Candidatus Kentron sp. FW]